MAFDKKKKVLLASPEAPLVWPRVNEPDTKFKKDGEYSTKQRYDKKAAAPFIKLLQPLYDEAIETGQQRYNDMPVAARKKLEAKGGKFSPNPLYTDVLDEDGEPTGEIEFSYKAMSKGITKADKAWTFRPALFDAKGNKLPASVSIWGGTVAQVSFEPRPYFVPATGAAGLSLHLEAVRVIDLVQGGQRNAGAYGFEAGEGFEYEPSDDDDSDNNDTDVNANTTDEEEDF